MAKFNYSLRYRSKPRKGLSRRKIRRRINRKKQVRNRTSVPVGLGFPKRMVMTHKYVDQFTLNTGVNGQTQYYHINCNSLYDPNSSGAGHQPLYFDQMSAIYDHYTVIGSKIRIRAVKTDNTTSAPTFVGLYINDDTTVVPSFFGGMEQSSARHKVLTVAAPMAYIISKWSAKKTFGGSVLGNDNLQGNNSSNPAEISAWTIYVDSSLNVQQTNVSFDIEVTYIAVWDELKDIAQS